jgi:hypothetical protein
VPNQLISQRNGDCGPTVAAVRPGGVEVPGDGVDNDCDGFDAARVTASPQPPDPGRNITITVTGATPGARVYFLKSNAGPGRGPCPPALNGTCAGLRAPSLLAVRTADATGRASTTLFAPNPYSNAWNLWFQAFIEGAPAVATNVFEEL